MEATKRGLACREVKEATGERTMKRQVGAVQAGRAVDGAVNEVVVVNL